MAEWYRIVFLSILEMHNQLPRGEWLCRVPNYADEIRILIYVSITTNIFNPSIRDIYI